MLIFMIKPHHTNRLFGADVANDAQKLRWRLNKMCGSGFYKLPFVAKSPKYGYAGQAAVASRLHIDFTVAYIYCILRSCTQCFQRQTDHIRCRFQRYALALPDGHIHHASEIRSIEFVDACLQFVADNGRTEPCLMDALKHLGHTGIEASSILTMDKIVRPKALKALFQQISANTFWNSSFYQLMNAVSNEAAYLVQGTLWPTHLAQGIVDAVGQVLQCVGECAVEVENYCINHGQTASCDSSTCL